VALTALGLSIPPPEGPCPCPGFELSRFWAESFATAAIARRVAAQLSYADREEAFTAGLLAGIGRLVFAYGLSEEYAQVLSQVRSGKSLFAAEHDVLGLDHCMFGAQLLTEWDLPDVLVDAVECQGPLHNSPEALPQAAILAQVLHCAVHLAPLFTSADDVTGPQRDLARRIVEQHLKLEEQDWQRIADEILADYHQVAGLFDVQLDASVSAFDLYSEAQEEATRVGMVAQLERTRALQENKDLLRRATTDALTGVANRAKFDERLKEAMAALRRGQGHFALLLFDIDHFKRFNDTYGHDVGDRVLERVAQTVANTLRDVDLLARYGGEEFVVLAPHTDQRGACIVAARIRRCVEELRVEANGEQLQVTVSVGLALTTDYATVPSAETLLADADRQMYASKHAGRNTWSYRNLSASQFAQSRRVPAETVSGSER